MGDAPLEAKTRQVFLGAVKSTSLAELSPIALQIPAAACEMLSSI